APTSTNGDKHRRNRLNLRYNPGRPMLISRAVTALLLCAVAVSSAGAARAAAATIDSGTLEGSRAPRDGLAQAKLALPHAPYEEVLASEGARLAARASQPEAAGALAALATLGEGGAPPPPRTGGR